MLLAAAALPPTGAGRAESGLSKLSGVYTIHFAGLRLGTFKVWSNVEGGGYSMRGKGEIKFVTSLLFELEGGTTSTGAVTENGPRPGSFAFDFKTRKKRGRLAMQFKGGKVKEVTSKPPLKESAKDVPLTNKHVDGVLDPLSAMFFTARSDDGDGLDASVCDRSLPIFDGKQRFDLRLSHKRTVQVRPKGRSGYDGPAIVCKVKYVPIAGYNPGHSGIEFLSDTDDIEVWLIPVPGNGMYVPYHMSVPTPYGTATATATAFNLELAGQKRIALVR